MIKRIMYAWYRRKHGIPSPKEIGALALRIKRTHLKFLALLYASGRNLDEISTIIAASPKRTAPSPIGARLFYGREHSRERLRQLIWKIWRDQRNVDRDIRETSQVPSSQDLEVRE